MLDHRHLKGHHKRILKKLLGILQGLLNIALTKSLKIFLNFLHKSYISVNQFRRKFSKYQDFTNKAPHHKFQWKDILLSFRKSWTKCQYWKCQLDLRGRNWVVQHVAALNFQVMSWEHFLLNKKQAQFYQKILDCF